MRPVLLTVDDDPQVVRAIERDLSLQYGKRFHVLKAESGQKALELLQYLKLRNETLALLLVDQRMPHLSGVAFLEQGHEYISRGQACIAYGLCRYRGRYKIH